MSIIKNVYGVFEIHESGLPFAKAVQECSRLIAATNGGEAYVVTTWVAHAMSGVSCTNRGPFTAYGPSRMPFTV